MNSVVITLLIAGCTLILQKTVSNLLVGIMFSITKPFKKGDKITVIRNNGMEFASGYVIKRGLIQTKLKSYNRDVYIFANALLDDSCIINSDYKLGVNHTEFIRVTLDSNLHQTKEIIRDLLLNFPGTTNTPDNTAILVKYEPGCIRVQYNIRTDDISSSYVVCSDFCGCLIGLLNMTEGITLV